MSTWRSPATICSTAGVPEGPEIGRRLEAVLELRLDGELADGREAELAAALDLAAPEENGAGGPA